MALAITRVARMSEAADSSTMIILAQGLIAETSVGLNAVAVLKDIAR